MYSTWASALFVLALASFPALIASLSTSTSSASAGSLIVNTTNGLITGHPASNISLVAEFLGIPYAQPPVGELRFAPPAKYAGHGPYVASNWVRSPALAGSGERIISNTPSQGYDCPQTDSPPVDYPGFTPQAQRIIAYFSDGAGTPKNEDCLTLNIWTRSSNLENSALKPVLILFYGGRFAIGNTHTPFYNGQFFAAAEDVVVVTVNYRLNIFGFPGAPNGTQNLALRDLRLAVEWVRDNAAAFGGDATKLTIFGQSSGAAAVDYWAYAYPDDPIVSGFISHSGTALSFPINSVELQESNWYNVSGEVGCGTSGDTLACMRSKNWTEIEAAAGKVPSTVGSNPVRSTPPFTPKVDNETIFSDYETLSSEGKFAKVPYLLGNNNHEQGYYVIPAYAHGVNVTKEQGDQFLLSTFTCANAFEAQKRRNHGVPVWQFRYFGHWSNIRLYPNSGAYHGSDLEMIFGNSAQVSGILPSAPEMRMTALMQHAWAAFAANPVNGLTDFGWPQYDPANKSLIRLAHNNVPNAEFVKPELYDAPCATVTLGAVQTST